MTMREAEITEKEKSLAALDVELNVTANMSDLRMLELKREIQREVLAKPSEREKAVEEREHLATSLVDEVTKEDNYVAGK